MQPVSLSTEIGKLKLECCLFNSANPKASFQRDLDNIGKSHAGAILTRTSLIDGFAHDDTQHRVAFHSGSNTINCYGYSPLFFSDYLALLPKLAHYRKPFFVSIIGTPDEISTMIQQASAFQATHSLPNLALEINVSCPNIPDHPPICYDLPLLEKYLGAVRTCVEQLPPPPANCAPLQIGFKLAAYFYEAQFRTVAEVFNKYADCVAFVTAMNTVGNGLVVDVDKEAPFLAPAGDFGGLGGPAVHAIALGNVRRLRLMLDPRIAIIGCGGVDSGAAAFRMILCGASAVQMASSLLHEGPEVFERIARELKGIMARKGYASVGQFCGKLRAKL